MAKWLFLLVFSLHMLPYHGAVSLRIPEVQRMRACDGPCSPINQYIFIPCHEEECFARAQKVEAQHCTRVHGPRHDTVAAPLVASTLISCPTPQLIAAKIQAPHIPTHLLVTQKRE